MERPCQHDVDVRCANNVSDWSLEHSFTVAWCVNAEDSSYIAVCYNCLWLIILRVERTNSHGIGGAEPRPDYYGDKNLRQTAM